MITPPAAPAPIAHSADGQVTARLHVAGLAIDIEIRVQPGYHVFAPGATEGLPVEVTIADSDAELSGLEYPESSSGRLSGVFHITAQLSRPASSAAIAVRVQPCNGLQCLRPSTLRFHWQGG
ncbi:hypothetical protein [Amycolatopsis pigmentata]|uniref:Thiol:disulfide interchange protein DsbD N-terminal domain-containing protein n=1 Tax=Amycolatopsis pigmentata TaxID=450801 RepID=A0ABW5G4L6_9PSEU